MRLGFDSKKDHDVKDEGSSARSSFGAKRLLAASALGIALSAIGMTWATGCTTAIEGLDPIKESPDASNEADATIDSGPQMKDAANDSEPDVMDSGNDSGPIMDSGPDTGPMDSGPTDSGMDAEMQDSGPEDSGVDAAMDSGPMDSGHEDSGLDGSADSGPDSGMDAGPTDSGSDSGVKDSGSDAGTPCSGSHSQNDPGGTFPLNADVTVGGYDFKYTSEVAGGITMDILCHSSAVVLYPNQTFLHADTVTYVRTVDGLSIDVTSNFDSPSSANVSVKVY